MASVRSAIRQLEVLAPGLGSLSVLRNWWLQPITQKYSLEAICEESFAATQLEQGLNRASLAYSEFPALIQRYVGFARASVSNGPRVGDFAKPLWLDWIEHTAEAVNIWRVQSYAMTAIHADQEFENQAWQRAVDAIRVGRPRTAKRIWLEAAERLTESANAKALLLRKAKEEFEFAVEVAATLGAPSLLEPSEVNDGGTLLDMLRNWWLEIGDPALERLFWAAHLPTLIRARNQPLHEITRTEKAALTNLIESAKVGGRPTFNEMHRLSATHAILFDEALSLLDKKDGTSFQA